MAGDPGLWGLPLLAGAVALGVLAGRAILLRLAPRWMAGPGGFLIDTSASRLGLLQMHDPRLRHRPGQDATGPDGGPGPDCR